MLYRAAFVVMSFLAGSAPVEAAPAILIECGESKGTAYFFEGGIVPPGYGGWHQDGVDKGLIRLTIDGTDLDVQFSGTDGQLRSHRAEGSIVRMVGFAPPQTYVVLTENRESGAVEHFLFRLNEAGSGTVVWGTIRPGGAATKSSLMSAICARR